jgi:transposase
MASMNKLDKTERARVIHLLCEGMSIRAITRLTGFSKTTVSKLVVDAGHAAAWY